LSLRPLPKVGRGLFSCSGKLFLPSGIDCQIDSKTKGGPAVSIVKNTAGDVDDLIFQDCWLPSDR
jgi:hypothetical protein